MQLVLVGDPETVRSQHEKKLGKLVEQPPLGTEK
jgi:hypothetical protein